MKPAATIRVCLALILAWPGRLWAAQEPQRAKLPPTRPAPAPDALTLEACVALALARSEEVAIRKELLTATEGRFLQALSGALPRVSFNLSEKRQDGSGGSAFTLRRVPERRFTFTQPLFSGFKEFAAMAGARAERRQRRHEELRAEQLLFVDVADAFYWLMEQRDTLGVLDAIRTALLHRLDELSERERLGRSRPSEVASAEAQLRRVEADLDAERTQETVARHLLEFLTGLPDIGALNNPERLPPLEEIGTYLAKADSRPDVQAALEASRVTKKQVLIEQSDLWPDVSLESNYYTERAGVAADINWDVLLTVNVPIFQGGKVVGAIREARSSARQAALAYEEAQRRARQDIEDRYAHVQGALTRHEALAKALEAAERNYEMQQADYRLNLVNNLEVLQSLEALEHARRDTVQAAYEIKQRYWQLRVATGDLRITRF